MTGFSADWLALREHADHAAINAGLRRKLIDHLKGRPDLRILDLGSGTGSNMRGLAADLRPARQDWHLVDYDADLLRHAAAACGGVTVSTRCTDFSDGDIGELLTDTDLVTASALFDLISPAVIERMAAPITANRQPFYTVLSYDGIASWLPEHPANGDMRRLFNAHQQSDKGFGIAAGPDATDHLEHTFRAAGYTTHRGPSPWVVTTRTAANLREAIDTGWANAVRETGQCDENDIDAWLHHRATSPDAVTIVGHEDFLALPPAG